MGKCYMIKKNPEEIELLKTWLNLAKENLLAAKALLDEVIWQFFIIAIPIPCTSANTLYPIAVMRQQVRFMFSLTIHTQFEHRQLSIINSQLTCDNNYMIRN